MYKYSYLSYVSIRMHACMYAYYVYRHMYLSTEIRVLAVHLAARILLAPLT